eukprot:scaffold3639_cov141-Isochrysis_galbana.AAC.19
MYIGPVRTSLATSLPVLVSVLAFVSASRNTISLPPRGKEIIVCGLKQQSSHVNDDRPSSPIVRSKGSRGSCGHRAVVVHATLNPSPRKRRPEEGEGMGDEWERGGGVTGRYWTEVSRRVAASV